MGPESRTVCFAEGSLSALHLATFSLVLTGPFLGGHVERAALSRPPSLLHYDLTLMTVSEFTHTGGQGFSIGIGGSGQVTQFSPQQKEKRSVNYLTEVKVRTKEKK